ncbi:MAG: hypothetical protein KBA31_10100 [Alphaproteobacteria bacterium]|nr:hypothetical protein [Alphaproteobacteria bacterium]
MHLLKNFPQARDATFVAIEFEPTVGDRRELSVVCPSRQRTPGSIADRPCGFEVGPQPTR